MLKKLGLPTLALVAMLTLFFLYRDPPAIERANDRGLSRDPQSPLGAADGPACLAPGHRGNLAIESGAVVRKYSVPRPTHLP